MHKMHIRQLFLGLCLTLPISAGNGISSFGKAIEPLIMNAITFASAYRQLQPVEKQFVDGYVDALEAAAERAGEKISEAINRPVPPEIIARSAGLLDRAIVRAAIAERVEAIAAASELSVGKVVRHLSAVAFSSMQDYQRLGEDGKPIFDFANVTKDQWLAVKSIECELTMRGTQRIKLVLHDKLAPLFEYMKMFGLTNPDNEHIRQHTARAIGAANSIPATVGQSQQSLQDYYSQLLQAS